MRLLGEDDPAVPDMLELGDSWWLDGFHSVFIKLHWLTGSGFCLELSPVMPNKKKSTLVIYCYKIINIVINSEVLHCCYYC